MGMTGLLEGRIPYRWPFVDANEKPLLCQGQGSYRTLAYSGVTQLFTSAEVVYGVTGTDVTEVPEWDSRAAIWLDPVTGMTIMSIE
jgi:hypothetical protein